MPESTRTDPTTSTARPRLSLVVIVRDEEERLQRCLASVRADEIIVVDSGSSDGTVAAARTLGARVLETTDWPGFGPQKNRAVDAATGDWLLSLDADEWIEPALMAEIEAVLASPDAADCYTMPRRSRFCGTVVRHSGWWPDEVLRLFRRGTARFTDDLLHERVIPSGRIGRLTQPIEHDAIASPEDAEQKIVRYGDAAAVQLVAAGKSGGRPKAALRSGWTWFRVLVLRLGLLDGRTGLRVAAYQAAQTYRKWSRINAVRRGE